MSRTYCLQNLIVKYLGRLLDGYGTQQKSNCKRTCGVISPKSTIKIVEDTTAIKPLDNESSKMVNVEFTSTLPSNILQSKKLP